MSTYSVWLQALVAAFIGGASNAVLNYLGLATAKGIGLDVPTLNWKALGMLALIGGMIALAAFLKTSPLPGSTTVTEQTTSTTKTVTKEDG